MRASLINKAWLFTQYRQAKHFHDNSNHCAKIQEALLLLNLRQNTATDIGRKFRFNRLINYEAFARNVPIIEEYSAIKPDIENMKAGGQDVLFKGAPHFFESTSGTSSEPKYIPFNKALKNELNKAIAVWMWELYRYDHAIFSGQAYWALSPAMKEPKFTASGIPVDTGNDLDYLGPVSAFFLKQVFAVPPELKCINDPAEFYVKTWRYLLNSPKLAFISVWSPQFLIRLLTFLKANVREISKNNNISRLKFDTIQSAISEDRLTFDFLFPNLRMLSCWTHGQSRIWLNQLKKITGRVPVQGKGLLATEGIVSIPLGMNKHVLSYTSHFYEFKDSKGNIKTASNLSEEEVCEVIITTGGGLYRYNMHDLVRCTGFYNSIPCFEFIGRSGNVSDLVGEKVAESSLNEILDTALNTFQHISALYLFPVHTEAGAQYTLAIEGEDHEAAAVRAFVEAELMKNPNYKQALKAGQLRGLSPFQVESGFTQRLTDHYQKKNNMADGDLKLPLLFPVNFLNDV